MSFPTKSPFEWHEVAPGQFEREIDAPEQFYTTMARSWAGTGHTFFAINAALDFKIDTALSPTELSGKVRRSFEKAWIRIRHQFPTLAAEVVYNEKEKKCKKVYKVPNSEDDVQAWVKETLITSDDTLDGFAHANQDLPLGNFATLHLLRTAPALCDAQHKMGLLFRSHHDIIDGVGTLKLLGHIFKLAAEYFTASSDGNTPLFGDEYTRLSKPLQLVAKLPAEPTNEQKKSYAQIQKDNSLARDGFEIIGYPGNVTATKPDKSHQLAINISEEETQRILQGCKTLQVTPTHLFHSAIALGLRDIQEPGAEPREGRYISYSLIDLRKICGKAGEEPASVLHCVSAKHLVLNLTIPNQSAKDIKVSKEELNYILYNVRAFYQSTVLDEDFLAMVPSAFVGSLPPYPEVIPPVPEVKSVRSVSLSSLGILDKLINPEHGPLKLYDPWVIGAEYGAGLGLFLGTFNGVMRVWAGYNTAFHEEANVVGFLHRVRDMALKMVETLV